MKASRQSSALRRISKYLDVNCRILDFKSFISSNFNYCPVSWMFCGKTNLNKFKKAVREGAVIRFPCCNVFIWKPVRAGEFSPYRIRCLGIVMYTCFHGLNPDYLSNLIRQPSTKCDLKDSYRLEQPKFNIFSYGQRSFRYYDSKLWNLRPYSVKNTKDFNILKTNITKWRYSKQCASFDMFWKSHAQRLPLYLSFILNSCGWCGNHDLFILSENCEFIRLFFLSPCIQYLTAIYAHVYFFSLTGVRVSIWYLFWSYIICL